MCFQLNCIKFFLSLKSKTSQIATKTALVVCSMLKTFQPDVIRIIRLHLCLQACSNITHTKYIGKQKCHIHIISRYMIYAITKEYSQEYFQPKIDRNTRISMAAALKIVP